MKTIIEAIKKIFYGDFSVSQFDTEDNISIELDDDNFFNHNSQN